MTEDQTSPTTLSAKETKEPKVKVVKVSKEEAQLFRQQQGPPYDEKVEGGFIVYSEPVADSEEISTLEIGANEYYTKNVTTYYSIDYNNPYEPGASGCDMTLTASASFSKQITVTGNISFTASMLKVISATIGGSYSVGDTLTVTNSGSKYVSGCGTLKGYPRYEYKSGELWEDDVFFDDYISSFKTKKLESIYYELKKW